MKAKDKPSEPVVPKGVTRRQALIAELCYLHPVWSCARVLREAGYSEKTALHAARQVMNTKGTKLALAQHRQTFMAHLGDRYSLEDATEDLVEIAKRGDNDATRLKAIERVLGHYGIIDPNVKSELYAAMGQYYADKIASLLREITPPKKRGYVSRWLLDMAAAEDPQEYETFEKALDVTPAKKRKPPGRNGGKDGGKTK